MSGELLEPGATEWQAVTAMSRKAALAAAACVFALSVVAGVSSARDSRTFQVATVAYVVDGDTIDLRGGGRVRLVQIDAPEVRERECYARRATGALRALLPPGATVALIPDARLDRVDRYGRLLRYVFRHGKNLNLALVARGAATVWFFAGERGRYATALLADARKARREHRGLWGACNAVWDPYGPATTRYKATRTSGRRCDASYPTVCIPPPPPDLDCSDVPYRNFDVRPPDPHHFDGDRDGRGCEG